MFVSIMCVILYRTKKVKRAPVKRENKKTTMKNLKYPFEKFKPLVVQSYRNKDYNGITYKRRLRINRFNAFLLDELLGTNMGYCATRFVVLDTADVKKACEVLGVEYKPATYFEVDYKMCSFSQVPSLQTKTNHT